MNADVRRVKSKAIGTNCILILLNMFCTNSSSNATPNSEFAFCVVLRSSSWLRLSVVTLIKRYLSLNNIYLQNSFDLVSWAFLSNFLFSLHQNNLKMCSKYLSWKTLVGKISNSVWKQRLRDGATVAHTRQLHILGNPNDVITAPACLCQIISSIHVFEFGFPVTLFKGRT